MGRHKLIDTPEQLWELFEAYKDSVKSRPRTNHVFVGKNGDDARQELERPLTMEGFEVYCFEHIGTVEHYFRNSNDSYGQFCTICSHIKKVIRQDQIEGGMVGQYNPSITQRLNGLKEQTETTITEQPFFKDDV